MGSRAAIVSQKKWVCPGWHGTPIVRTAACLSGTHIAALMTKKCWQGRAVCYRAAKVETPTWKLAVLTPPAAEADDKEATNVWLDMLLIVLLEANDELPLLQLSSSRMMSQPASELHRPPDALVRVLSVRHPRTTMPLGSNRVSASVMSFLTQPVTLSRRTMDAPVDVGTGKRACGCAECLATAGTGQTAEEEVPPGAKLLPLLLTI